MTIQQRTQAEMPYDIGRVAIVTSTPEANEPETDIFDIWDALRARKRMIGIFALVLTLIALIYVLVATPWYRVEVVLAPAGKDAGQDMGSQLGGLGGLAGLASLAGIRVGAESNPEAIALLESRGFAREFIESTNLLPILYAKDWDAATSTWKSPDREPDIRDAVKLFQKKIRRVHEDTKTGLVTLSVDWEDPRIAADWANEMVARLNDDMRQRALEDAEANLKYLRQELAAANVVPLQQSIGSLIEREMQKLMIARGNEQFAFRVVDAASPPKRPAYPRRVVIVVLAFAVGVILASLVALMQHAKERRDQRVKLRAQPGTEESQHA